MPKRRILQWFILFPDKGEGQCLICLCSPSSQYILYTQEMSGEYSEKWRTSERVRGKLSETNCSYFKIRYVAENNLNVARPKGYGPFEQQWRIFLITICELLRHPPQNLKIELQMKITKFMTRNIDSRLRKVVCFFQDEKYMTCNIRSWRDLLSHFFNK